MTQTPTTPDEPNFENVNQIRYIDSNEAANILNVDESLLLSTVQQNSHPIFRFEKQDDHRLGIRSYKVLRRETGAYEFFLTFGDDLDDES